MKILFVAPYPVALAPSQRFRFEQYLFALTQEGHTYEYHPFIDIPTWQILHTPGQFVQKAWGILKAFARRFSLLFRLSAFDYIFIHREASHIGPPIFEWAMARIFKKKIIYDFDDAIWLPNYSMHNRRFHWLKYYQKVHAVMRWSYRVSAGNQYLAQYAGQFNPNVVINPTTIDTAHYHNRIKIHTNAPLVLGWTGTLTTIRYLLPVLPILSELEKKYAFTFQVIANEDPAFELSSFQFVRWKKETEIDDLLQFSIGLMPLEDDRWAKGKCGFKALQYMALGIPAVVSPVGVNTEIVTHGHDGFICRTDTDWYQALEALLQSAALRAEMGHAARQTIVKRYSVASNTSNFLQLFS